MAAPKDPSNKPVSLDLNLDQVTKVDSQPNEPTGVKFRPLDATVQKPEKPQNAPPPTPTRPMQARGRPVKAAKKKSNSKSLFIFAGVVIIGVLGFQFLSSHDISVSNATGPAPALAARPAKSVTTEALPKAPPPVATAPVDPYGDIRDAGLDQLTPEVDEKGNTAFAVRVIPKHVCYPADVEAMRIVVGSTGSLLLSLEPMAENSKTKAPITSTISLKDIAQGTQVSLPVNLKETGVYGIYICTDAAEKRRCGGKPAADFNKILNHKELDVASNAVFYYQFSVLGLDYATIYSGSPETVGSVREQLKEKKSDRDWRPELEKAANMMRGVKSYPPRTERQGHAIVMELPVAMVNPDGSCR